MAGELTEPDCSRSADEGVINQPAVVAHNRQHQAVIGPYDSGPYCWAMAASAGAAFSAVDSGDALSSESLSDFIVIGFKTDENNPGKCHYKFLRPDV